MNADTINPGSTLEILLPYLLLGIQVQTPDGMGKLVANDTEEEWGLTVIVDHSRNTYPARFVTPFLKPFESLAVPLEDGTIPAQQVGRLTRLLHERDKVTKVFYWPEHRTCGDCIEMERELSWSCRLTRADFESENYRLRVVNYLRSLSFAVGLTPNQFLPL